MMVVVVVVVGMKGEEGMVGTAAGTGTVLSGSMRIPSSAMAATRVRVISTLGGEERVVGLRDGMGPEGISTGDERCARPAQTAASTASLPLPCRINQGGGETT